MMRRLMIAVAAALLACVASASALAAARETGKPGDCKPRTYAFAGSVSSIGSDSLIVEVDQTHSHDEGLGGERVKVSVNQATRIERDGKPIQLSDLVRGEHVAVVATGCRGRGADQTFTAKLIRAGDRELSLGGSVVSVGSGSLTVEVDKSGPVSAAAASAAGTASLVGRQVTVAVSSATRITRDGKPIQLGDLVVGEHVLVRVRAVGSVYTALWIRAGDHDIHLVGTISSVGGNSLMLQVDRAGKNASDLDGRQVTLAVDQNTKILVNGQPAQLSDLKSGERAEVHAQGIAGHYAALEIRVRVPKPKPPKPALSSTTTTTSQH